MRITKFGHACLYIEEGQARILIDPGVYSRGFEVVEQVDAILITHQHPDHMEPGNLKPLMAKHPQAKLYADEEAAKLLAAQAIAVETVRSGDTLEVAGTRVAVMGQDHAQIHPDVPRIKNVGYVIAEKFFYPGDNFTLPERAIEVLAAPVGAPWLKMSEVVDYVRAVKPRVVIPVHDAVLAIPEMNYGLLTQLTAGRGIEVRVVKNGESTEI